MVRSIQQEINNINKSYNLFGRGETMASLYTQTLREKLLGPGPFKCMSDRSLLEEERVVSFQRGSNALQK